MTIHRGISSALFGTSRRTTFCWLAVAAYYCLRIIYLDADGAPWGVISYQPIDEGTYANLALNMQNFGSINPNDYYQGDYEYLMQPHVISGVITNAIVWASMTVLGDNYFGLRMGGVLVGFVILILTYLCVESMLEQAGEDRLVRRAWGFVSILLLLVSFPFYDATRCVEPTLYRLLFVQVILLVLVRSRIDVRARGLLAGFFAILSIFLVYVTNVFVGIVLITYFIALLVRDGKRNALLFLCFGIVGALCAYGLAFAYYQYWGTTPVHNLLDAVSSFGADEEGSHSSNYNVGLMGALVNIRAFSIANIELYSIPLVMLCFVLIGSLGSFIRTGAKLSVITLVSAIVAFFLQTLFAQDYVVRKELVIFPAILMLLVCLCQHELSQVGKHQVGGMVNLVVPYVLGVAFITVLVFMRCFHVQNEAITFLDFSAIDIATLVVTAAAAIILGGAYIVSRMGGRIAATRMLVVALVTLFVCSNVSFIIRYHFLDQTYSDVQLCRDLGATVGDGVVAGEFECGFTLYNDIHPLLNASDVLQNYLSDNPQILYFDYANVQSFSSDPDSLRSHLVTKKEFERMFRTYGVARGLALYTYS